MIQQSRLVSTQTNLEYADIAKVKTENDLLTQQQSKLVKMSIDTSKSPSVQEVTPVPANLDALAILQQKIDMLQNELKASQQQTVKKEEEAKELIQMLDEFELKSQEQADRIQALEQELIESRANEQSQSDQLSHAQQIQKQYEQLQELYAQSQALVKNLQSKIADSDTQCRKVTT